VGEGVLEFEAAAADVFEIGAEEADDSGGRDRGAGFVYALFVDEDAAGEDESLGAFARGGVCLIDEEFIETKFFCGWLCGMCGVGHWVGRWVVLMLRVRVCGRLRWGVAASIFSRLLESVICRCCKVFV
jgi:hypothetical protein